MATEHPGIIDFGTKRNHGLLHYQPHTNSIPIPQHTTHIARHNFRALSRMPSHRDHRPLLARLNLMPHFARLPIPEAQISPTISWGYHVSRWGYRHVYSISSVIMSPETLEESAQSALRSKKKEVCTYLLPILPELIASTVNNNLVVRALESHVLLGWMLGSAC